MRIMIAIALSSCLLFADGGLFVPGGSTARSTGQTAVIKYDQGREELMLATAFRAGTGNLAWLVPLPAKPDVDSVSDRVFQVLKQYINACRLARIPHPGGASGAPGASPGAAVTELSRGFIRNYSYQVLKAFGAETLEDYLTGHGYRLPPGTRGAFQHYLDQGWRYYFIARVDSTLPASSGQRLGIKLTFVTDSIVYPLYISRISSQDGPVELYVLADHQQTFPEAQLEFSRKVDRSAFPELPGFINRTCRLTELYRHFDPDAMEDLCLRDALNEEDEPPKWPAYPNRASPIPRIAANPVTGKAYATSDYDHLNVIQTVDGDSFWSTTVPLSHNDGIAADPRTNRIYVAGFGYGSVLELDGANDGPILPTIQVGWSAGPIAVNPVTNRVYVGLKHGETVYNDPTILTDLTIIDARTRATRRIRTRGGTNDIAVDTVRDKVFALCIDSSFVTVLRGDGSNVRCIPIGGEGLEPCNVAVDQATGKAYIARYGDNQVTVLRPDGTHRELAAGANPIAVAVNSATHRAYVANYGSNNVTVIRGETVLGTVPVGLGPIAVAVNPRTNRIYVANSLGASVTIINGRNLAATEVAARDEPSGLAVDQKADRVFVVNLGRHGTLESATVLDGDGNRSWEVDLSNGTVHKK